ncbi:MAG: hypothetical protein RLZZ175_570 [Bacteroidota bacterium]|jgi:hypothetical protein
MSNIYSILATFQEKIANPITEDELNDTSNQLVDEISANIGFRYKILEPIFILIENNLAVDFGEENPIIKLIEAIDGYEVALKQSLKRNATQTTFTIYRRLLKTYISKAERLDALNELKNITSESIKEDSLYDLLEEIIQENLKK